MTSAVLRTGILYLLAGLSALAAPQAAVAQEPQLRAWVDRPALPPGDTVRVSLALGLDGTAVPELMGVSFKLDFDTTRLAYAGHVPGELFASAVAEERGSELGPTLAGAATVAYGVTLYDGVAEAITEARGEVVQVLFRVRPEAEPGLAALAVRDARRSTPDEPGLAVARLRADGIWVTDGLRSRQVVVGADDVGHRRFDELDGFSVRFEALDRTTLLRAERDPAYGAHPVLPDDLVAAAAGSWTLTVDPVPVFTAEVCVPLAAAPELKAGRQDALRLLQHTGAGWEVLSTTAYPADEAPARVCSSTSRPGRLVLAAPATAVSLEEQGVQLHGPSIEAVYPNPVRDAATVRYTIPVAGHVRIALYDLIGRAVAVLQDGVRPAGPHRLVWTHPDLAPGMYVIRFEASEAVHAYRLVVVR